MMEEQTEHSQLLAEVPKKRSQADKKGRIKYTFELLHQILDEISLLRMGQRHIITGLELAEMMHFDQPYLEKAVCRDEVDKIILRTLWDAKHRGLLPKEIIVQIRDPNLKDRWQILHRIEHMNKRLNEEIGEIVAEKVGHKWTLTEFAYQAYKLTRQEMKAGQIEDMEGGKE